jgi:mono/diheme cytochrome c family protein
MKRSPRWIAIGLGSLLGLVVIAYCVAYLLSERALRRTYAIPAVTLSIPTDPASVAEGQRLATVRGCVGACHGKEGEGRVLLDELMIARVVAPNLTAAVRKYSDAELAVIIRNGVRPDGRSMVIMPSAAFVGITDGDLGRIIAFLRSLPAATGPEPSVSIGPLGRVGLAVGRFKVEAQFIAEAIPPPEATSEEATHGRYLARTICAHCHGTDLRGVSVPNPSPSLQIVAAYSPEAFTQLMRTGVALGGRNLETMSPWARKLLSQLTDAEIAALYSYLHTMPDPAHN